MSLSTPKPNSLLSEVGIAGHPWHGRVDGGVLALPNSTTRAYAQPSGGPAFMHGTTRLLKVPGVPEVVRSSEEQGGDTGAGLQWWNSAILAGATAQLYGRQLGDGAWIYCDPLGKKWLVTTTLNYASIAVAGGSVTVTLARFGVFGGEPEQYAYTVAVPSDIGQLAPELDVNNNELVIVLSASHPAGASALFQVYATYMDHPAFRHRSVGWLKLTISGNGNAANIGITVERTRLQCMGTLTDTGAPDIAVNYLKINETESVSSDVSPPACQGTETTTTTAVPTVYAAQPDGSPQFVFRYSQSVGMQTITLTGLVLALFYHADGTIGEITYDQTWSADLSNPAISAAVVSTRVFRRIFTGGIVAGVCQPSDSVLDQEWQVNLSRTCSAATSLTMTIRVDGLIAQKKNYTVSDIYESSVIVKSDSDMTHSVTETASYTPGAGDGKSYSGPGRHPPDLLGIVDSLYSVLDVSRGVAFAPVTDTPVRFLQIGYLALTGWFFNQGVMGGLSMSLARHAAAVFGFVETRQPIAGGSGASLIGVYLSGTTTPAGFVAAAEVADPAGFVETSSDYAELYGSWCPVTGEVARSFNPVCWV